MGGVESAFQGASSADSWARGVGFPGQVALQVFCAHAGQDAEAEAWAAERKRGGEGGRGRGAAGAAQASGRRRRPAHNGEPSQDGQGTLSAFYDTHEAEVDKDLAMNHEWEKAKGVKRHTGRCF